MQMSAPAPKQVVGVARVSGVWKCIVAECSGMIGDGRIQMSAGETPPRANDSHASLPTAWQTTSLTGPQPARGAITGASAGKKTKKQYLSRQMILRREIIDADIRVALQ